MVASPMSPNSRSEPQPGSRTGPRRPRRPCPGRAGLGRCAVLEAELGAVQPLRQFDAQGPAQHLHDLGTDARRTGGCRGGVPSRPSRPRRLTRSCPRLMAPKPHLPRRCASTATVRGSVALRNRIAAQLPGLKRFLRRSTRMRRIRVVTAPKIDVDRAGTQALVADRAVVGHVVHLVEVAQRDAAARLLLVQEGLDDQSRREDLVARRVQQVGTRHVRHAVRLALAAAQAVPHVVVEGAELGLLEDDRFLLHEAQGGRVGQIEVAPSSSLPRLKWPSGSTRRLYSAKAARLSGSR